MKRSIKSSVLLCAVALLLTTGAAQAAPITVNNFSFEDPDVGNGGATWSNVTPPGWQEPTADGGDSFTEEIGGFTSHEEQHEGIQNGSFIWQDLGVPAQALTEYTLTVAVGNRNAQYSPPGNVSRFQLLAGGPTGTVIATRDVDASTIGTSTFMDFSAIGATGAAAPTGNLTIRLATAGLERAHFDNIRLDAVPIPEPATAVGAVGLAACGLMARRCRRTLHGAAGGAES
jgi:hypothetical protein